MPLTFDGRFQSGQITTPMTAGSGLPIVDTYYYSGTDENGNPMGNDYRPTNLSRVVTSPRWSGDYAFKQTIDYTHDYRPFNGGTLQKPRSALLMNHPESLIKAGREYKIGFAFLLPSDFILEDNTNNPDSLVQFLRSSGGKPKHLASIVVVGDEIHLGVDWRDGDPDNTQQITLPATRGVWHRFVFHIRPAKNAGQSGFFRIYKDGDSANALYEHTGINTDNDDHKFAINLYKYAWWATIQGPGYNGPESDARKDWNWLKNNKPNQTNDKGRRTIYWDHLMIWEGSDGTFDDVSPNWTGGGGGGFAEITGMNLGAPIPPNADNIRFTGQGTDFSGVFKAVITDRLGTSEDTFMAIGQASSGRFNTDALTGLTLGAGTVGLVHKTPLYDSETASGTDDGSIRDWATFNCSVTPYDNGGDWASTFGNQKAALIQNTSAGGSCYATMKAGERVSVTSGQQVIYRAIMSAGTTNQAFLRVQTEGGNKVEVRGALGALSGFETIQTGSDHVIRQWDRDGIHFIEIEFTATETETYHGKMGTSSGVLDDNILGIRAQIWADRDTGASTVTHDVELDVPDLVPPSILDAQLTQGPNGTLTLSADISKLSGTVYKVVTSSGTAPSAAQIIAGTDELGAPALWAGNVPADSLAVNSETPGISKYVDKYAYFVQVDASGNQSAVVAAEDYIPAEAVPGAVLKLSFSSSTGLLKRTRKSAYTGTFDHLKLFDKNPLQYGSYSPSNPEGARLLAQADSVVVTAGALLIGEEDLTLGSLNQLSLGVGYWFYAFDVDKDPFAFGETELVEE